MVISSSDLLQVVSLLSAEQNLQVTVNQSLKGGAIAGLGAFLGGLALGPRGLAIGGASGGLLAAVLAEDSFKSVADVIRYDMKNDDREQLVALVRGIIHDVDAQDLIALTAVVNATPALKRHIITEVTRFFSRRMNVTIQ
ncbi:hypothetical protein TCAL_06685 [Tigriopus californicus]|uniref:Glycine zipper domain-containing protein n=1 Tax=Tigriopus californicus TaxID=6832 RepID=A0A553N7K3_TIGCA|nr:protein C19orf12-like isoform X2 [Tigriopus californicus]TRY61416.1 hypothetical protein TCAL_06685 [Tigriopus californicus]